MKTVQFYEKTNRSDNLLHIETDGCVVNIRVGLTDSEGRKVTSVQILPEDEDRGGDGEGRVWHLLDGARVVRQEPNPPRLELEPGETVVRVIRENSSALEVGDLARFMTFDPDGDMVFQAVDKSHPRYRGSWVLRRGDFEVVE